MRDPCGDGFGFEKLDVWHRAMDFADEVYDLTKQFPREELFGLTMQLRRASVSVPANIAEGTRARRAVTRHASLRSPTGP